VAIVFALGSSLVWGCADFMGGVFSRRLPLAAVLAAHALLGERISRVQRSAVALALAGVAVVAAVR